MGSLKSDLTNSINQINSTLTKNKLNNNGYYSDAISINDMLTEGIHRFYVNNGTDNANYLGWTGRTLLICSGNCAGFMHQIFFYVDGGCCAIRRNVTQGNIVFDFDVPLHRIDSKVEITQLENRIKALETLINN